MANANKYAEIIEFRNKLIDRGFDQSYRWSDWDYEKNYDKIVTLHLSINTTKKGDLKNIKANVRFQWIDTLHSNGLPSSLDLGKPCRQLDMAFVMKCEAIASKMSEEITEMKKSLERMAKKMELPKDNGQWITNGNTDTDDRVDEAQSWGIFS